MPDIFLSYSRDDQPVARRYAEAFQAEGFDVWWDTTLRPGEAYDEVTEKALRDARAVVVLWSQKSVASRWVRAEATLALRNNTLLPVMMETCERPIMFELTQTADLANWRGDGADLNWAAFIAEVRRMVGRGVATAPRVVAAPVATSQRGARPAVLVLPFVNMSGDKEQEYFSDGISEDIITDLSKVSTLWVAARNTAFSFKGEHIDVQKIAHQLNLTHVLEGSVRKAGGRVRITAQLIDATGGHVWAERYDRELSDIFALQDEISQAIVAALKLKLLPEEKKAIQTRGTTNLEAYNLYLMARQHNVTGTIGNAHRSESIIRLCRRATEIDPNYALAWALMASAQGRLRHERGQGENGLAAAERALAIDPNLAEAHAAKSEYLKDNARYDEAWLETETALRLDPESYEVNYAAARLSYATRRIPEAIRYFEKAASLMENDFGSAGLLVSCYKDTGDIEGSNRWARAVLERVEKVISAEPDNGSAMGFAVGAHSKLGNAERAREWAARAMLLDPDNKNMRYNFACAFVELDDMDEALTLLEGVLALSGTEHLNWTKKDSDLDPLRDHPRFIAMIAAAEARLASAT